MDPTIVTAQKDGRAAIVRKMLMNVQVSHVKLPWFVIINMDRFLAMFPRRVYLYIQNFFNSYSIILKVIPLRSI
jgi:hypothetical protein